MPKASPEVMEAVPENSEIRHHITKLEKGRRIICPQGHKAVQNHLSAQNVRYSRCWQKGWPDTRTDIWTPLSKRSVSVRWSMRLGKRKATVGFGQHLSIYSPWAHQNSFEALPYRRSHQGNDDQLLWKGLSFSLKPQTTPHRQFKTPNLHR